MDPVSDNLVFESTEIDKLKFEIKELKRERLTLKVGICCIAILAIFNIWWYRYVGYKQGYEEAVKASYKGTSLKCTVINDKVVWIKK